MLPRTFELLTAVLLGPPSTGLVEGKFERKIIIMQVGWKWKKVELQRLGERKNTCGVLASLAAPKRSNEVDSDENNKRNNKN